MIIKGDGSTTKTSRTKSTCFTSFRSTRKSICSTISIWGTHASGENTFLFSLHTYYRCNRYVLVVLLIGTAGLVRVTKKPCIIIFF